MLNIGYITPYRITLLLLIKKLCGYKYPEDLISNFVIFLTKCILSEDSIRETCSEPTLEQLFLEIEKFSENEMSIHQTISSIQQELILINGPHKLDKFMASLTYIVEDEEVEPIEKEIILSKSSVMGLFVRRCKIEYLSTPFHQLIDVREAFNQYIHGQSGDLQFLGENKATWVSSYNIKEFLKAQAEKIERTGTSNINPKALHNYLADMTIEAPRVSNIHQVRYLNYTRTREYVQSLSSLHQFFDYSLREAVGVQYALLNISILEYKFGHLYNALSSLNDALSAARYANDELCLQEVQYWIEVCRKNQSVNNNASYSDDYLNNMKTLTRARDMLREGNLPRHVFEVLYKSLVNIKLKKINDMDRVQHLVSSLAWQRYGNSTLAETYQRLAENSKDETIEVIEKTVISHANMLQSMGKSEKALEKLKKFHEDYPTESDFLIDWKQAEARIKRQSNKRRKFDMLENQADLLQYTIPPYSEEYFNAVHDNAERLMKNDEFEKALSVLDEVHDFFRKTDQTSQLGYNLILQAVIYLQTNDIKASIPLLIEAMSLTKRSNDAKNYFKATIKLSEAYVRTKDDTNIKKSIFMLETIFPKVLLTKAKLLISDLYLTYAEALDTSGIQKDVLEYIVVAINGYRELNMKTQELRALHFKTMVLQKRHLPHEVMQTAKEIRNIQTRID